LQLLAGLGCDQQPDATGTPVTYLMVGSL